MLENSLARLKQLQNNAEKLEDALQITLEDAKERVPVDTGELKDSGKVKNNSIVFEAPYAAKIHEDLTQQHSKGEAKFLEKAWAITKQKILNKLINK